MISHSLTYWRKNCTLTGSGKYSAGSLTSSSMKSSSVSISTSESSTLIPVGRPMAVATERSLVKSVHQIRFQRRLSALLSCEDSTLRYHVRQREALICSLVLIHTSGASLILVPPLSQPSSSRRHFLSHLYKGQLFSFIKRPSLQGVQTFRTLPIPSQEHQCLHNGNSIIFVIGII